MSVGSTIMGKNSDLAVLTLHKESKMRSVLKKQAVLRGLPAPSWEVEKKQMCDRKLTKATERTTLPKLYLI